MKQVHRKLLLSLNSTWRTKNCQKQKKIISLSTFQFKMLNWIPKKTQTDTKMTVKCPSCHKCQIGKQKKKIKEVGIYFRFLILMTISKKSTFTIVRINRHWMNLKKFKGAVQSGIRCRALLTTALLVLSNITDTDLYYYIIFSIDSQKCN